ncbi:MAG TPA: M56 family metallopeptidase [Hymenobacter sp.]
MLLYLLKANGALLLFAAAYFGLLRPLTFFTLNRLYLLFALLFSAVYPALPVPTLLPATPLFPVAITMPTALSSLPTMAAPVGLTWSWEAAGLTLYCLGAAVGLIHLLWQLASVWQLRRASCPVVVVDFAVRQLPGEVRPFSFWRTIYLNPAHHPGPELTAVLRHEQVHVRQWHTLDVLLSQLVLAAAWCNPAAWLLRRALLDTLEYVADHAALQTGLDRRAYQYSLLRLSQGAACPALVSQFTFLTLKNRIAMMNAPASAATQRGRYLLAVTLVLALRFGAAQARNSAAAHPSRRGDKPAPSAWYLNGKRSDQASVNRLDPATIAYMQVLPSETARKIFGPRSEGVAVVVTKGNEHSAAVKELNARIFSVAPLIPGTETAVEVNALTSAARAYLTEAYPTSRIVKVSKLTSARQQVSYKVELAEGSRLHYAFFDEQGNPSKL